ncbi:MAG: SDR family NAD(P)-dependent oxidoreductase [Actinomycetota bacterium]|nr:SDR family NAD(P)-dependent oxidoreductase [Actinomycetota bacterium]
MHQLTGRVVAITGAGSGIGRALARRFALEGSHLALSDVDAEGLAETARLLTDLAVRVTTAVVDVSDEQAVLDWAQAVVADHGRVNVIVNNAGVALSGTVAGLSIADYRWIMGINFWGVVHGTKAFLPHLEASGEGHVVNISSVFGLTAQPFMSGYNASKFAVRGFTESLRQELDLTDSTVTATCVHPGGIKTNIARSARMSESMVTTTGQSAEESAAEFEKLFLTTADAAARVIVKGVKRNRRRVLIGADARVFDAMPRLAPTGYQRLIGAVIRSRMRRK